MKTTNCNEKESINRKICTELIIQYNKHYEEVKEFLKEWQLTVGQYEILEKISKYNGITQKELSKDLILAKANIGQSLFKLKMAKMISYEKKLNKQYIYLTFLGMKILKELENRNKDFYEKRYVNLSDKQRKELYKLLKLVNNG